MSDGLINFMFISLKNAYKVRNVKALERNSDKFDLIYG